jgi:glutathione S-transferase
VRFSFPRRTAALQKSGKYPALFTFEEAIARDPRIEKYLNSDRRRQFSMGLFRKYDELDADD